MSHGDLFEDALENFNDNINWGPKVIQPDRRLILPPNMFEKTFEHAIADLKLNSPKHVNDMYLLQDMLKLPEDERKEYRKRLAYCNAHLDRCWPNMKKELGI